MIVEYGFFSEKAASHYGYCVYRMEDGGLEKITAIFQDKDAPTYNWEDKKYVGIVANFVKLVKPSEFQINKETVFDMQDIYRKS